MRTHFYAQHEQTGVIHLAGPETDAHPKMRPITLAEARAAGIDTSQFDSAEGTLPAPKKRIGRPKKAVTEVPVGKVVITGENEEVVVVPTAQ